MKIIRINYYMTKKKILVLGNGISINDIDFSKLDPSIQTFGVNRIFLKHFPTYYFFHDADIITELNRDHITRSKLIANSIIYSSDWIDRSGISTPHWLRKYPRKMRKQFPDSISTGLGILGKDILPGKISDYVFYMAGINLKWSDPSHFWKTLEYKSLNKHNREWYDIRFQKMIKNIGDLKVVGYNMISVTPDSMLNKMMRYENISNLYSI
jgi:hypothetical protein